MSSEIGSRELKNRLGTYLRRVREGETIQVTERGRPIAELRPITPPADDLEARLRKLAAEGFLTLPSRGSWVPFEQVPIAGPSLSQLIDEDREERF